MNRDSSRDSVMENQKRENEILLKMARPDIYRINAFRILGIPVTASQSQISSRLQKLKLLEKYGNVEQKDTRYLPVIPAPDDDARREAEQRLTDPESRLVDEFFWFWSINMSLSENQDEALCALRDNNYTDAVSVWKQHEKESSEANVSMHNLAILYHTLALDLEFMATLQKLSEKQQQQKNEYWKEVYPRWHVLLNYEGFWKRLKQRIHEFDDPRLTTGTARSIREGLSLVLLTINAKLAVQFSENDDREGALYHVSLMEDSKFDVKVIDEALRQAITPIRDRFKIICTHAEEETTKNPEHADEIAWNLIEQTTQLLKTIDILLPKEHIIRQTLHDEVASQVLGSSIAFGNKTKNWSVALELAEQALQIAVGFSVRQRSEENISVMKSNIEAGICWFCQTRPAVEGAAVEVKMYGDVNRTLYNVQWRHGTIEVPRCSECKAEHSRKDDAAGTGCIVGAVAGLAGGILMGATIHWFLGVIAFAVCSITGAVIGNYIGESKGLTGVKPEDYKKEFPRIKELLSNGWSFGEKPSNIQ